MVQILSFNIAVFWDVKPLLYGGSRFIRNVGNLEIFALLGCYSV
jgi:hypothetical protein